MYSYVKCTHAFSVSGHNEYILRASLTPPPSLLQSSEGPFVSSTDHSHGTSDSTEKEKSPENGFAG